MTRFDQPTLAEWLQLYRELIRGDLSAVYAHEEKGTVWVKKHADVSHDRLPRKKDG